MPELPEVEICRRNLARWSEGRAVVSWACLEQGAVRGHLSTRPADALPDPAEAVDPLLGRVTTDLVRHGKRIGWWFGDVGLLVHLGMTGRWIRRTPADPVPRSARLGVLLAGDVQLWFVDTRRFGCVVPGTVAVLQGALAAGLGPDALTSPLGGPELAAQFGPRSVIKPALMQQHRLAGVGNIQALEALYRSRISPWSRAASLDGSDWQRLAEAIVEQLEHTIAITDAEDVVYMTDGGGDSPFEVYGRGGEPCRRCGEVILSERQAGRVTLWCPECQIARDA